MPPSRLFSRPALGVRIALASLLLASCLPATAVMVTGPDPAAYAARLAPGAALPAGISEHVVVISVDGLRPDAIERFGARTLQRLMREGSYSLAARTILPSITLPSHTSMLTGEGPDTHGVLWNDNRVAEEGTVAVPTILALARERGLHTAAFFSKGKFHHLLPPGSVNHAVAPGGNGNWLSGRTMSHVEAYLEEARPNLLVVHFGDVDYAGHTMGWMSRVYGWAVRRVDGAVERVLEAADRAYGKGNYTVLVTADHGGHGRSHGSEDPRDVTIPWIAWGKGIRTDGVEIAAGVHTMDTAATALRLLGVEETVAGEPVLGAFDAAALAGAGLPDERAR